MVRRRLVKKWGTGIVGSSFECGSSEDEGVAETALAKKTRVASSRGMSTILAMSEPGFTISK